MSMISFIQSLASGNAVKVALNPPKQADRWRLLRKATDDFTGQDDPAAAVILDGDERYIVDRTTLLNGNVYHYKLYSLIGANWVTTPSVQVTVTAGYFGISNDPLDVIRERLELGLKVEVTRGKLKHARDYIPVKTAFPFNEAAMWPMVTVHVQSVSTDTRAIGELWETDADEDMDGGLDRWRIDVIGWTMNPDERNELRKAIRRVIVANLPLFDDVGMIQIDFSQMDAEELADKDKNIVIYKTVGSFSCLAPFVVANEGPTVETVETTVNTINYEVNQ